MIPPALISFLTGGLVDKIADVAKAYMTKQISEAEFRSKVEIATKDAAVKIEQAWSDAAVKQYEQFQQSVRSSPIVQRAYAAVIVTQLFVLLWYQWGAAALELTTGMKWPAPTATVDWAYAILALCLGGGVFVFKGSGSSK